MNFLQTLSLVLNILIVSFFLFLLVYYFVNDKVSDKKKEKRKEQEEERSKIEKQNKPKWVYANENPAKNTTYDCQIRAIAKALDLDWETVYNELYNLGLKSFVVYNHPSNLENYLFGYGYVAVPLGKKKYVEFKDEIKGRKVILQSDNHMVLCEDNIFYDTFDSTEERFVKYFIQEGDL